VLTFSAKGHAFEGVKERYSAHRGNVLLAMDDFQTIQIDRIAEKRRIRLRYRDHGHKASVLHSYNLSRDKAAPGLPVADIWDTGNVFLSTKDALEAGHPVTVEKLVPTSKG